MRGSASQPTQAAGRTRMGAHPTEYMGSLMARFHRSRRSSSLCGCSRTVPSGSMMLSASTCGRGCCPGPCAAAGGAGRRRCCRRRRGSGGGLPSAGSSCRWPAASRCRCAGPLQLQGRLSAAEAMAGAAGRGCAAGCRGRVVPGCNAGGRRGHRVCRELGAADTAGTPPGRHRSRDVLELEPGAEHLELHRLHALAATPAARTAPQARTLRGLPRRAVPR